jgi:hypothetical protein
MRSSLGKEKRTSWSRRNPHSLPIQAGLEELFFWADTICEFSENALVE